MAESNDSITDNSNLELKNHRKQVYIENALDDDNSIARLSPQTMDAMELFCGDTIKLKGKQKHEIICIVLSDDTCQNDRIRVNRTVQHNLRVNRGRSISIEVCRNIKCGSKIHVSPIHYTVENFQADLLPDMLQSYFLGACRPVCIGNIFTVQVKMRVVQFKVIETEPNPYCIVTPETIIHCGGDHVQCDPEDININDVYFDDIGGLEEIKQELRGIVRYNIEKRETYSKIGMAPARGVLLYGPTGCGKTLLIKALVNECDINLIMVRSYELLRVSYGEMIQKLRETFAIARQRMPCVVFIDGMDCLHKVAGTDTTNSTTSTTAPIDIIINELDTMDSKAQMIIIGAINRPDHIEHSLLRPGRLDQLIYVPLPDEKSREAILRIAFRDLQLALDVDLLTLAKIMKGASGADIFELRQIALKQTNRHSIENEKKAEFLKLSTELNANRSTFELRRDHFESALKLLSQHVSTDNNIHKYQSFMEASHLRRNGNAPVLTLFSALYVNNTGSAKEQTTAYIEDDDLYT